MHFPQPMTAGDVGSDWIPLRAERVMNADVVAKKRKHSHREVKQNAVKARSRTRVSLGLAFSRFGALK